MKRSSVSGRAMVSTNHQSAYTEYQLQRVLAGDFDGLSPDQREQVKHVPRSDRPGFFKSLYTSHLNDCHNALLEGLTASDPLNLLAMLANAGHLKIGSESKRPIHQVHIELAQFLVLKHSSGSGEKPDPSLAGYSKFVHSLQDYLLYSGLLRSPVLDPALMPEELQKRRMSYVVAQNFAGLRNWAYPDELDSLLSRLTEPLEGRLQQRLGYRVTEIVLFWRKLSNAIYERLVFLDQVRKTAHLENERAHQELGSLVERATALGLDSLRPILEQKARPDLQPILNKNMAAVFTFDRHRLLDYSGDGKKRATLDEYIDDLALSFGDLRDHELADAIYDNPIWLKPLLRTETDQFFICVPSIFHSFAFRHLDALFGKAALSKEYEARRARFLEDETLEKVQTAFPSAEVFSSNYYSHGPKRMENDLLVKIGNWLIVVEAKSHKVTPPAQRGAIERLGYVIEKLMTDPSEQSMLFARYLSDNGPRCVLERHNRSKWTLDTSGCVRIIRLTVILEPLGSLAAQVGAIRESGLVPNDHAFAITMNLADLDVVLQFLTTQEERLDYLFRRVGLWKSAPVDGEERDLLVFYLAAQLRAQWKPSQDGAFFGIAGWRRKLDDYYYAPFEGRGPVRYVREYTDLWRATLRVVSEPPRSCWPEAAALLLTFGHEEQIAVEKKIYQTLKSRTSGTAQSLSILGWDEKTAIFFKAFKSKDLDWGAKQMEQEALRYLKDGKADQVLWIAFAGVPILRPTRFGMKTNHDRPRLI